MNDFRFMLRQMSLPLVVWGVPAFLFWFLLGTFFHSELQRETSQRYRELEKNVYDFATESDGFLQWHLQSFSQEVLRTDASRFGELVQTHFPSFPPGRFQLAIFDLHGKVLYSTIPRLNGAMESFFSYVRQPGYENLRVPFNTFSEMKEIIRDPFQVAPFLRNLPNLLIDPQSRFEDLRVFWNWSPPSLQGSAAGFLFTIDPQMVPFHFRLSQTAQKLRRQGIQVEFLGEDQHSFVQARDLQGRLDSHVILNGRLVVFRKIGNLPILFSSCPIPAASKPALALLSLMYFCFSLFFLRLGYQTQVLKIASGWSFRTRLLSMYLLGYGLPLGISFLLILLFLPEQREMLANSLRNQAFERLSQLDLQYRNIPIRRGILLRELTRKVGTGQTTIGSFAQSLWTLYDQNDVDAMWVISSQSVPIVQRDLCHRGTWRALLKRPLEERIAEFKSFWKEGRYPPQFGFTDLFSGNWQNQRPESEMANKLVMQVAQAAMAEFNQKQGFELPASPGKSSLLVAGMSDSLLEEAGKNLRSGKGRIQLSDFEYLYGDIISGKTGRADYFVLVDQTTNSLETAYLRHHFSASPLRNDPFSIWGFGRGNYYNPTLPDNSHQAFLRSISERMLSSQRDFLVWPTTLNGKPVEVLCYKGVNILEYFLMAIIPQELVGELLRQTFLQLGLFLLGALLLGAVHTQLLRKHFFLPIHDLTTGIAAITRKEFTHQLPVRSQDEWGELAHEFNKAILHLQEMEIASVIQKNLLGPEFFRFQEWEFLAKNQMTQAIGGDYFDFIPVGPGKIAVILGDVSGHGISAALVTAMGKAGFSILCPRFPDQPVEVFSRVNRIFLETLKRKKMMTCFMAVVDTEANTMDVANAGQCYPLALYPDGSLSPLELTSFPLGIAPNRKSPQRRVSPTPQAIIFYSDGFPEALDENGEQVGYDRFTEILKKALSENKPDPLTDIFNEVKSITGQVPWNDDATAVVIRKIRNPEPKPNP